MTIMHTATIKKDGGSAFERLDQLLLQSKALTAVDSGILITDRQARILWVNPAFSKSTGYPAEEILGKTPRVFKSGMHDQSFYRRFWDTVKSGETWRGRFVNRRRHGSFCVHAQTTTPVLQHGSGPITHFISVNEDLSDGKPYGEDPCELRNREVVIQLAAGIAHHLNNLLTVIHCNSELLLEQGGALDPEFKDLAKRTLSASNRAAHLVRQLVGFSQSQVMEFRARDFNQVVKDILQVSCATAPGNIKLECGRFDELPSVLADSGALRQVISHLLANAIDAMPLGGRLILTTGRIVITPAEIRNHLAARPGVFVYLIIQDTGSGILPINLPRIFDPFFTTKVTGNRSGLGLALIQGIVRQHRGWIEVSSEVSRGTTFTIFLPAVSESIEVTSIEPGSSDPSLRPAKRLLEPGADARRTTFQEPLTGSAEPPTHWGINE